MISALQDAASAAGENAVASADLAGLGVLADRLDEAALLVIAFTLRRSGLFSDPDATHRLQDVLAATKAAPRHHRIVRRWLTVLLHENMITFCTDGRYRDLRAVEAAEVERALAGLDAAARGFAHGPGLTRFFQQSAAYLPDLLTDAISLQALLFAGDDLDVADDVYRRNLASRYTNQAAAAVIRDFVRQRRHPAKVLEIGAGAGGTTAPSSSSSLSSIWTPPTAGRESSSPWPTWTRCPPAAAWPQWCARAAWRARAWTSSIP